ncbi:MAG: fibronectin type III domain-containing protein, partial [archaeon]
GQTQPLDTTLQWMREFQRDFGFDGWYFDNAEAGDFLGDYGFIKQVRADIGDSGIIYHHDSVDVWGPHIGSPQLSGLRAVFVDAYANYTLAGETGEIAEIDGPNDPYLRYFSSGYGLSQAFGSHKILSSAKLALTDFDKMRAMGQNLFGAERGVFSGDATGRYRYQPWLTHFKPAFEAKKAQYLSGTFNTSPDWPLNTQASWYREPLNFSIASNAANSVTINWQTSEPATSEIAYTGNGVFPANPQITDSTLATSHSATVNGLAAGTTYEFRARSSNRQSVPQEIVWNKVVAYTT